MLTPPQQPLSPFAQINQSLPPLAPPQQEQKPPATMVFAPIHAPTHAPQLHMGATPQDTPPPMADLSGMAQRPSPLQTFAAPSSPNVFAKPSAPTPGSIEDEQQHVQGKLAKDYQKDIDPWGSPDNHPGVFGKIMHGLSKAGNIAGDIADPGLMRAIPSTDLGRQAEEKNLEKKEVGLTDEQAKNKLSGAQTDEAEATIPLRENQAEAAKLIEITPDMATALGNSSLAGQQVSQGVLQHLQATHENNSTKLTTTGQNNTTKMGIAELQSADKQAAAAGKAPAHIVSMYKGEPHIMERDPSSGAYSVDRGVAPPTYAQMFPEYLSTKTIQVLGDDGMMHNKQFDPTTKSFDIEAGAHPTGTAGHQIFQAHAIEELAPQVINDINANRDLLGNLDSYYKQWTAGTPVSDPRAAQLMTELMSLAAMQPALHAFRSTSAMESFEKMIGGLSKNPDATIATINGLMKTPQAFTSLPNSGGPAKPTGKIPSHGAEPPRPSNVPAGYHFEENGKQGRGWYK